MLNLMSISDWILIAIDKSIWGVFITGPLNLISAFSEVLRYLAGGIVWDLLFSGSQSFSFGNVPAAFYGFCILALFIVVVIFAIQFVIMQFGEEKDLKYKLVKALKMTGLGAVIVFFIPICFFLLNALIVFLNLSLNSIFGLNDSNIADAIYNIGNPNWDGHSMPAPGNYSPPDDILKWNIMAEVFGVWFMTFAIFMLGLALVQKIFELFFLFLIGPIVACTMVNDDGKRMLTWKDYCISKAIASVGTLISYYVFMVSISLILGHAMHQFSNFARELMTILFICGGALATLGMSHLVAAFVGESVGISEGLGSIRSTMAAGMFTMGGMKMVGRAMGFGKASKKRLEKNRKLFGATGAYGGTGGDGGDGGDNVTPNNNGGGIQYHPLQNRSGVLGMIGGGLSAASIAVGGSIFAIRNAHEWNTTKAYGNSFIKGKSAYKINKKTGEIATYKKGLHAGEFKLRAGVKMAAAARTIVSAPLMPVIGAKNYAGKKIKEAGTSIKHSAFDVGKNHYKNLTNVPVAKRKNENKFESSKWAAEKNQTKK